MELKVKDCESTKELVINSDDDANKALNVMLKHRLSSLPVIDKNDNFVEY
jgi:CBS domain-containing protein